MAKKTGKPDFLNIPDLPEEEAGRDPFVIPDLPDAPEENGAFVIPDVPDVDEEPGALYIPDVTVEDEEPGAVYIPDVTVEDEERQAAVIPDEIKESAAPVLADVDQVTQAAEATEAVEVTGSVQVSAAPPHAGANLLKLCLIPFVCFWLYGFPDGKGLVSTLSGFVIPAYYILCGYFVLVEDREERLGKLRRGIGRNLLFFVCLMALYMIVSVSLVPTDINYVLRVFFSKRIQFEFLVLNLWPFLIGSTIWFIQALLFACIGLYILDKLNLLRFYRIIMIVSMVLMVLLGELAGVIRFSFLGYTYIPGNFFTRALPYLLLGMLLREKREALLRHGAWLWLLLFAAGGSLAFGELWLLSQLGKLVYNAHTLGFGLMAFALCAWALGHPELRSAGLTRMVNRFAPFFPRVVYALAPLAELILYLLTYGHSAAFQQTMLFWEGPLVLLLCLAAGILLSLLRYFAGRVIHRQ